MYRYEKSGSVFLRISNALHDDLCTFMKNLAQFFFRIKNALHDDLCTFMKNLAQFFLE